MANVQLQQRDLDVLGDLLDCRILTISHISELRFEGHAEAAKKRIAKLKNAGLISERKRHVNEPSVLFLARAGFELLQDEGHLQHYPDLSISTLVKRADVSPQTIEHELEVADVRAAIWAAILPTIEFAVAEFTTWPLLSQFSVEHPASRKEVTVKPDGFLRVVEEVSPAERYEHCFFLEVDRSSEAIERLTDKAIGYLAYYKSGGFAVRFGAAPADYRSYPFRVLIVAKTAERRNNLALRLLESTPPILTQTWLTTLPELLADALGLIWVCPADFRGLREKGQQPSFNQGEYRRNVARDEFLESALKKRSLFEDC